MTSNKTYTLGTKQPTIHNNLPANPSNKTATSNTVNNNNCMTTPRASSMYNEGYAVEANIVNHLELALHALYMASVETTDWKMLYASRNLTSRYLGNNINSKISRVAYNKINKLNKRAELLHSYVLELIDKVELTSKELGK